MPQRFKAQDSGSRRHSFLGTLLPKLIIAIIYYLTHLKDWNGLETGGILFFQSIIIVTAFFLADGQFKLETITVAAFIGGLAVIGSIAKSL